MQDAEIPVNSGMKRWVKRALRWMGTGILAGLGFFVACQLLVWGIARGRVFDKAAEVPARPVALVLGSSPRTVGNRPNPYFRARMMAAYRLYRDGKVRHFLVSGDNRTLNYNEPAAMRSALMALGIPDSAITLDYAGLRTLDSVVRCRKIFGQHRVVIVSQPDHVARAIFLGRMFGLDPVGMSAAQPIGEYQTWFLARESLARVRAVLDAIIRVEPRHLGNYEPIKV